MEVPTSRLSFLPVPMRRNRSRRSVRKSIRLTVGRSRVKFRPKRPKIPIYPACQTENLVPSGSGFRFSALCSGFPAPANPVRLRRRRPERRPLWPATAAIRQRSGNDFTANRNFVQKWRRPACRGRRCTAQHVRVPAAGLPESKGDRSPGSSPRYRFRLPRMPRTRARPTWVATVRAALFMAASRTVSR